MKNLIKLLLPALILLGCGRSDAANPYEKLFYAINAIDQAYVDEVNADTLTTEAIVAMLKTLDPHSSYTDAEETKELTQPLDGKFSGIGIQFSIVKDTVYVVQTTVGGPSERAGLRPGDRIIYVNDTLFTHPKMVNSEVLKTLRGPKGTKVALKVKRGEQMIDFTLTRDDIPIYSVDAVYMADPTTGYIRVSRFAESTPDEVAEAIAKLKKQGMKNLIIDLEDNGGGYLGAAHGMASQFLKPGDLVVSTKGRAVPDRHFNVSEKNNNDDIERIVVMVNQYSASASEIFSGAMQDYDRALIVGRRTFGKGLVQTPIPFPDGSMIRLTTARYYIPSGRLIQKEYEKGHSEEYQLDMLTRYESGELFSADSVKLDTSHPYKTLRNGRTVYGGGGIMPDVFVPLDTTQYSTYYRDLMAKGVFNTFALKYLESNRERLLKQFPTEDDFADKFVITQDILDELIQTGENEEVPFKQEGFDTSRVLIESIIKGLIERDLYENGVYSRAVNHLNPVFREALRLIHNPEEYNRLLGNH
ncbi:MAG: S41 family peptidase [Muribaculaceae bacterium]|nr:S41 family peptidase [Muribaculaceae bacterium]